MGPLLYLYAELTKAFKHKCRSKHLQALAFLKRACNNVASGMGRIAMEAAG